MGGRHYRNVITLLLIVATIGLARPGITQTQTDSPSEGNFIHTAGTSVPSVCADVAVPSPVKDALRLVCRQGPIGIAGLAVQGAIVVGFVGGFVKADDAKHPEVEFAAYLRDLYFPVLHVAVFPNHKGTEAVRQIRHLLDINGDGMLAPSEKEQARIIIYGHSWGASQAVTLARELGKQGVPVLLTIQVDSIRKRGQDDSTIPPNVQRAANFYQPKGVLHGRSTIRAVDPIRTRILGNFRMTYTEHRIDCSNYPWFVRVFNKPHHEIENDPRVWEQIAVLINSELSSTRPTTQTSSASPSLPPLK